MVGEEMNEMKLLSLGFSFGFTYVGSDRSSILITLFEALNTTHSDDCGGRGREGVVIPFSSFLRFDASFLFFMSSTRCSNSCVFTWIRSSCDILEASVAPFS